MLMPFPCHSLVRRQALRALGKASQSSQEGGNTGRRAMQPYRPKRAGRPFSSRPGSSGERALYADLAKAQPANAVLSRIHFGAQPVVDGPDLVGKADRHRGALAQALRSRRFKGQMLVAVERVEELLQASSEQHLLESRIGVRAR